jgi:hypothetical protein
VIAGFCESVLRLMVAVLASVLCLEIVPEPALAERQVNNLGPQQQLERAVNDARSVSAAFASFGFDLVHAENVGRGACNAAGQKVLAELQPGDPAAIYVSGRGLGRGSTAAIRRTAVTAGAGS